MQQNSVTTSHPETVAQVWYHSGELGASGPVLPDGCRDLIVTEQDGHSPSWHVSELFDAPHHSQLRTVKRMIGFRLQPGTMVNERELISELNLLQSWDEATVAQLLADHTRTHKRVAEALSCIAEEQRPIAASARTLGVTLKTLQRILTQHTSRTPVYWRQLARIRKTARCIENAENWADFALDNGFSDQAHMAREFQRWFGVSPSQFAETPGFKRQARSVAFG